MIRKKWKIIGLLLILTIPACLPLIRSGFYEPHDLHHLADIYQMVRAIQSGQIPPRWAPDFLYGFGYPLFNFYYVLPFYVGAIFFLLGFALTSSFKLVFLLSIVLSVMAMYLFLREFFTEKASIVGAILFLYTPYRAVEVYVRGAIGEALGLSFLPLIFLVLTKVIKKPSKTSIITSSIVITLFLLSHNYLWFLSLPYILIFIIFLFDQQKKIRAYFKPLVFSGILALGLSAYWWLPAIWERKYIERLTPFRFEDHFPFIQQLIVPSWGYGSSVWGPADEISFQIGIVNLLILGLTGFLFAFRRKLFDGNIKRMALWTLTGMMATLFMMNIRSLFLWKLIPFYQFIQFPWRLLIFTTFLTSVMAAVLVEVSKKTKFKTFPILMIVSSMLLTVNYFRPSKITDKTDNEYLARFFANRTVEGEKKKISEEYLRWSEDYLLLPNWVSERPDKYPKSVVEIVEGKGQISGLKKGENWISFTTDIESEKSLVRVNKLYFPGWKVFSNDQEIEIFIPEDEKHGRLSFELLKGNHNVVVKLTETPIRTLANFLSLISLMVVISFLLWPKRAN